MAGWNLRFLLTIRLVTLLGDFFTLPIDAFFDLFRGAGCLLFIEEFWYPASLPRLT